MLASASPRRRHMLEELGIRFSVAHSRFPEPPHAHGLAPSAYVRKNAEMKARSVAATQKDALVIGADTVVVQRGRVLGKPQSIQEAFDYMHLLNGKTHAVYTGLCLIDSADGSVLNSYEKTLVAFRKLTEEEIRQYLARIYPLDKAGAYAIQGHGALIVERIEGCYYNVVGFPIAKLESLLLRKGISLFDYMKKGRGHGSC